MALITRLEKTKKLHFQTLLKGRQVASLSVQIILYIVTSCITISATVIFPTIDIEVNIVPIVIRKDIRSYYCNRHYTPPFLKYLSILLSYVV